MPDKNFQFPSSLKEFGYMFNEDGKLRKIDSSTGQPGETGFEFNIREDPSNYNQEHYEALGEAITDHVYHLLEDELGLVKLPVPVSCSKGEPSTFIFATPGALEQDFLLVLLHGSGVVRAGQWARSIIINHDLRDGTQIPYIEKAKELGYGVLVLNTNDVYREVDGKKVSIKGSSDAEEHTLYAWDHYVRAAKARHIALVAHSYGGVCICHLAQQRLQEVRERVFAVALTDSVHYFSGTSILVTETRAFLRKVGRNWGQSREPLDTPLVVGYNKDVETVSAGHPKHEMTSATCRVSLFRFIEERRGLRLALEAAGGSSRQEL